MEATTLLNEQNKKETKFTSKRDYGHQLLDVFVGKWKTTGHTSPGALGPSTKIIGTDTYAWLPGGFFLVHRVDVRLNNEGMKALEIIGFDVPNQSYWTHAYDSLGNYNTYRASVQDGVWSFEKEGERATVLFSDTGKSMTIKWEKSNDKTGWVPWMDMELTRIE